MTDKRGLISRLNQGACGAPVVLELGCGNCKRNADAIGVDMIDYPCVDIVGDIAEVLAALPRRSISTIRSFHCLEHLDHVGDVLRKMEAALAVNGMAEIVVPHFSNPYFYSDYTHRQFFGLYTFSYLATDTLFKRKVPQYQAATRLRLVEVALEFKSTPPFYGRHAVKRAIGKVVNSCRAAQEFYEEMLCWIFPCHEIRYVLQKVERE